MNQEHREKPYPEFPLNWHKTGYWYKRIAGKVYYFGKRWGSHHEALEDYLLRRDGAKPEKPEQSECVLNIDFLVNTFLASKDRQMKAGELSQRSWNDYFRICTLITEALGKPRLVEDMDPHAFGLLKAQLVEGVGVQTAANRIRLARIVFRFAEQEDLIEGRIRFGSQFKQTSKTVLRRDKQNRVATHGTREFSPDQIRKLLAAANKQMKAMIYLGINCAYGNTDCSSLLWTHIKKEWAVYPRQKTSVDRLAYLWPETRTALEAIKSEDARVFSRRTGSDWVKVTDKCVDDGVAKEFAKLMTVVKLSRPGLSFYSLRHTFRTVADNCLDPVACGIVMGHTDNSMAANYRSSVSEQRVRTVCEYVRQWVALDSPQPSELMTPDDGVSHLSGPDDPCAAPDHSTCS